MSILNISIVQPNLVWEDKSINLNHLDELLSQIEDKTHIVVLPEMFSTGFSMNAHKLAETVDGETIQWLRLKAEQYKKIFTGSVIFKDGDNYYNRLIWMQPDGIFYHYDKRHLFSYAGEGQHYQSGNKRLIVRVNGWKIMLQICYDLRFPIWNRQLPGDADQKYDLLINVANWPERRNMPWKVLLQARSIENQAFVIGCNRFGNDGNQVYHSGDSSVFDPLGNLVQQLSNEEGVINVQLDKELVEKTRNKFGFLNDADDYNIL